ncbi:hypothetical protein niasHS_016422 [Heterodera schachtii]|uniref:Uncharacterized protein n=1 Tax=Heterodera schachtii TaxID=97005 RepID=A0ABD2HQ88_HETSC
MLLLIGDKLCAGMDTKRTTTGTAPPPTHLREIPMPSSEQQMTPSASGTSSVTDEIVGQQGQMQWHQMPEAQFGQMPTDDYPFYQNWEQSFVLPNVEQEFEGLDHFYQNDFQMPVDKEWHQSEREQPIGNNEPSLDGWQRQDGEENEEVNQSDQKAQPLQMTKGVGKFDAAKLDNQLSPTLAELIAIFGSPRPPAGSGQNVTNNQIGNMEYSETSANNLNLAKYQPEFGMDAQGANQPPTQLSPTWAALIASLGSPRPPAASGQNMPDKSANYLETEQPKAEANTLDLLSPDSWALLIRDFEQLSPLTPPAAKIVPSNDQKQKEPVVIIIDDDDDDDDANANSHQKRTNRGMAVATNKGKKPAQSPFIGRSDAIVPSSKLTPIVPAPQLHFAAGIGVPPAKLDLSPLPRTLPPVSTLKGISPRTAAAFPIARKRRPPLPPIRVPSQTNQSHGQSIAAPLNFREGKVLARKKAAKFELGQSSTQSAGQQQQKMVAAGVGHGEHMQQKGQGQHGIQGHQVIQGQGIYNKGAVAGFLLYCVRKIVLVSLRSLQIASPDSFFDGTIQQIRNGHPLEMALGPPKMALAKKLSQMNAMEVAKGIKMHLLNDGETKNNRIFAEIIEQTMANCVAVFGQTALTNGDNVNVNASSNDGDDISPSVVLFFFSRLFRKLAGFLNAPFMEKMEFNAELKGTNRVAMFILIREIRTLFVSQFEASFKFIVHKEQKIQQAKELNKLDAFETAIERFSLAHLAICSTISAFTDKKICQIDLRNFFILLAKFLRRNFACLLLSKENISNFVQMITHYMTIEFGRFGISQNLLIILQNWMKNEIKSESNRAMPINLSRYVANLIVNLFTIVRQFLPKNAKDSLADNQFMAHGWDEMGHFLSTAGKQLTELVQHLDNWKAAESAKLGENDSKIDAEQSAKRDFWHKNCTNFASSSGTKQQN